MIIQLTQFTKRKSENSNTFKLLCDETMKMPRVQVKNIQLCFSAFWYTRTQWQGRPRLLAPPQDPTASNSVYQLHLTFMLPSICLFSCFSVLCVCLCSLKWFLYIRCGARVAVARLNRYTGRLISEGQSPLSVLILSSRLNVWPTTY